MRAPRLPSIFKLSEHNRYKKFQYEPRTFDERKERLEKRRREIAAELEREQRMGEAYRDDFRERIQDSWHRRETRRQQRNSTYRLFVILAALLFLLYYIFHKFGFLL